MTARRALIRLLDRRGGRWLLSALASWYARRATGRKITVWYDGLWIRSLESKIHVADTPRFEYFTTDIEAFPKLADNIVPASEEV